MQKETIGNAELYLGDCREILPKLTGIDAVITDPPYGLGDRLDGGSGEWVKGFGDGAPEWDKEVVSGIETMLINFKICIIWGGNYYNLPPQRGWLLWDKMQEHSSGHAEMAWTNLNQPVRTFRLSRVQAYSLMDKQHPTQKPINLMQWCIRQAGDPLVICDPFMGSGSTGVAAMNMQRQFIGIEKEQKYFDIACQRIEQSQMQLKLGL